MENYEISKGLRLRSYENGYVMEVKKKTKIGDEYWTGISWYGNITSALLGVSDRLVRRNSKPLPEALLEAASTLDVARKALMSQVEQK